MTDIKDNVPAGYVLISQEDLRLALASGLHGNFDTNYLSAAAWSHAHTNVRLLELFLEAGADVNDPKTMLYAISEGVTKSVKFLFERGANPNSKTPGGDPMLAAALGGFRCGTEVVDLFIKSGADVNATSKEGDTMLMVAAQCMSPDNVKALLDAGANPHKRNAKNQTALDFISSIISKADTVASEPRTKEGKEGARRTREWFQSKRELCKALIQDAMSHLGTTGPQLPEDMPIAAGGSVAVLKS